MKAARRARRRRLTADLLARLGAGLTVGAAVGLLAVVADRALAMGLDWRVLLGAPAAVAVFWALATAWRERPGASESASVVDHALGLRDRLGSAIELTARRDEDPFVMLLDQQADDAARRADVRRATPIALTRSWLLWPVLGAMGLAAALFMPMLDLLGEKEEQRLAAERQAARQEAAEQIAQAAEALTDPDRAEGAPDPAAAEAARLEEMVEQITAELTRGEKDADEALADAAGEMDKAAEALEQEAQEAQAEQDALRQMLAQAAQENMSEFEDALQAGDMEAALSALQEMAEALSKMSKEEREAMAQSLEALSERLAEAAQGEDGEQSAEQAQQENEQALKDQGLSAEDAQRLAGGTDQESLAEALQKMGVEAETAQRMAEQIAQRNQDAQSQQSASRRAEQMSEALRQMAQQCENPQQGQEGPEGQQGDPGRQAPQMDAAQMREALERMAQQGQMSDAQMKMAQAMRQRAQDLIGAMTPEERERWLQAMGACPNGQCGQCARCLSPSGAGGREAGSGPASSKSPAEIAAEYGTRDVDGRRADGGGAVVGQLPRGERPDWDPGSGARPPATLLREAAEGADRAIETQAAPHRYNRHIERYFERFEDLAPPAKDAKDSKDAPAPAPAPAAPEKKDGGAGE